MTLMKQRRKGMTFVAKVILGCFGSVLDSGRSSRSELEAWFDRRTTPRDRIYAA
jgi:hypothetical protein